MTTTTNTTLMNLSSGTALRLNGRNFTVGQVIDMAKYPNAARYVAACYEICGPRGSSYKLDVRRNGSAFYVTTGRRARAVEIDASFTVVG